VIKSSVTVYDIERRACNGNGVFEIETLNVCRGIAPPQYSQILLARLSDRQLAASIKEVVAMISDSCAYFQH